MSPLYYFTDPILRGPTIGSMLMCLAAGLVGVIVFLRKQSLLGEALSHASYPGVILGVIVAGIVGLDTRFGETLSLFIIGGAFITALLGTAAINLMVKRLNVRSDSALCFILSAFFGIGLMLASQVQFVYPTLYQQVQIYLYGQAATMTDLHIKVYAIIAIVISCVALLLYKEIQLITFDETYATSLGFRTKFIETFFFFLTVSAIVIGIRSVGVVLMSAMLIAPAAAARQYSNKLYIMLILAGLFGLASGYFGNFLSTEGTVYLLNMYPGSKFSLPTGPMIVLVAAMICLFSLLFAPERGLVIRFFRIAKFRYLCTCENVLKAMWRMGPESDLSFADIQSYQAVSTTYLKIILRRLAKSGWVEKHGVNMYQLTHDGALWAAKIIRLHRLWEVYLADYLGVGAERVHRSAEEMEHIITPDLERELTLLLDDPKEDPHHQPIPPMEIL